MRTFIRIFVVSASLLLANPVSADDFQSGLDAYNSADYETAMAKWQPLAEAGDARGQYGMGLLYGNGFGVMMDDAQALHWYGLAAEGGHGEAANKLGVMHQNGWGVPMSDEEAARWYTMAAEQGVTEAQKALGNLFAADYSPVHDKKRAYMWYAIAAKLGDINAQAEQEDLARRMDTDMVIEAEGLVGIWFQGRESLLANQPE
ncbi:MAG: tetratricopeptide repeat protein [Woeseiaceae bacterium]